MNLEKCLKDIEKDCAAEIHARREAQVRLDRLQTAADQAWARSVELEEQIEATKTAITINIADGNSEKVAQLRTQLNALRINHQAEQDEISSVTGQGIDEVEEKLKTCTDTLFTKIGAALDIVRIEYEIEQEKAFDQMFTEFQKFDEIIGTFLKKIDCVYPNFGLMGGSDRLSARLTAEKIIAHVCRNYASASIDLSMAREQINERRRRILNASKGGVQ